MADVSLIVSGIASHKSDSPACVWASAFVGLKWEVVTTVESPEPFIERSALGHIRTAAYSAKKRSAKGFSTAYLLLWGTPLRETGNREKIHYVATLHLYCTNLSTKLIRSLLHLSLE